MEEDVVLLRVRKRYFTVPDKTEEGFTIDVWKRVTGEQASVSALANKPPDSVIMSLTEQEALAALEQMYPLPQHMRSEYTSAIYARNATSGVILASNSFPFIESDDSDAELASQGIGKFLIPEFDADEFTYFDPKDGFRCMKKLMFMQVSGDSPDAKDAHGGRKYRRRRYHYHDDEKQFSVGLMKHQPGADYSAKRTVRVLPVTKEHIYALARMVATNVPGTVRCEKYFTISTLISIFERHIGHFVGLFGKRSYRQHRAFLSLIDRYIKNRKSSITKIDNRDICTWLDEESKNREVRKLLREIRKSKDTDDWSDDPHTYTGASPSEIYKCPIKEATRRKYWRESQEYEEREKKRIAEYAKLEKEKALEEAGEKAKAAEVSQKAGRKTKARRKTKSAGKKGSRSKKAGKAKEVRRRAA